MWEIGSRVRCGVPPAGWPPPPAVRALPLGGDPTVISPQFPGGTSGGSSLGVDAVAEGPPSGPSAADCSDALGVVMPSDCGRAYD